MGVRKIPRWVSRSEGKGESKNARQTELVHQEKGTGIWGLQAGQVEQVVNILIACEGPEAPVAVLGLSRSTGVPHQLATPFQRRHCDKPVSPQLYPGQGRGWGRREGNRKRAESSRIVRKSPWPGPAAVSQDGDD